MLTKLLARRCRRTDARDRSHEDETAGAIIVPASPDAGGDPATTTMRYPLSWPARDLARTRRLGSRPQAPMREADAEEDDPTKLWPRDKDEDRSRR